MLNPFPTNLKRNTCGNSKNSHNSFAMQAYLYQSLATLLWSFGFLDQNNFRVDILGPLCDLCFVFVGSTYSVFLNQVNLFSCTTTRLESGADLLRAVVRGRCGRKDKYLTNYFQFNAVRNKYCIYTKTKRLDSWIFHQCINCLQQPNSHFPTDPCCFVLYQTFFVGILKQFGQHCPPNCLLSFTNYLTIY